MSATATQSGSKAQRLADSGAVRYLPAARVYPVFGDSGAYLVIVDGEHAHCSCPKHGACSHIEAVRLTRSREAAPAASVLL